MSTDNPNLISVLDIHKQIHEAEEEDEEEKEEEYLPPDSYWEEENIGAYKSEEMGYGVLDVNIPPEIKQHSTCVYIYIYIYAYI